MPNKHILFCNSLLAIAGVVRLKLKGTPKTVDELWVELKGSSQSSLIQFDFTQLILALNLLFAINQLQLDEYEKLVVKDSFGEAINNETD